MRGFVKKMIAIPTAVSLVCSMAAMPTLAEEEEQVVIRIAWWGNQTRNDLTVQALDLYTELHPNVSFETEPSSWDGYFDKLATQAATGSMPDIYQQDYGYVGTYYQKDLMLNLQPYVEDGTLDVSRVSDAVLESGSFDGDLYALCIGLNSPALFYDKETVEAAGVTIPAQMTWDEFFEISETIYEKTGVQTYIDSMVLGMLFRGIGTSEYAEDGTSFGVEDDTVFQTYFQMIADASASEWHVSPEILTEKNPTVTETMPIIDQTCWNSFSNSNQYGIISSTAGRELGITMWPVMEDDTTQVQYLKSSQFLCGSSTTEHPEIVADVINFIVTSIDANEILNGERGVPVDSDVLASFSDRLSDTDKVVYQFIDDVNAVATPMDLPSPSGSSEIGTLIEDLTELVRYGEITPEEAAAQVFEEGNEILAQNAAEAETK
jgi:multiple sugar transport system substrate-binding protein